MIWGMSPLEMLIPTAAAHVLWTYNTVLSRYPIFRQFYDFEYFLNDSLISVIRIWSYHYPRASSNLSQVLLSVSVCWHRLLSSLPSNSQSRLLVGLDSFRTSTSNLIDWFAPEPLTKATSVLDRLSQYVSSALSFLCGSFSRTALRPTATIPLKYAMPSYILMPASLMDEWLPDSDTLQRWNFSALSSGFPSTSKPSDVDAEMARIYLVKLSPPRHDLSGLFAALVLMLASMVVVYLLLKIKLAKASARTRHTSASVLRTSGASSALDQGASQNTLRGTPSTQASRSSGLSRDTLVHHTKTPGRLLASSTEFWRVKMDSAPIAHSTPWIRTSKEDAHHGKKLTLQSFDNKLILTASPMQHKLEGTQNSSVGLAASKCIPEKVDAAELLYSPTDDSEETRHPSAGLVASEPANGNRNEKAVPSIRPRETRHPLGGPVALKSENGNGNTNLKATSQGSCSADAIEIPTKTRLHLTNGRSGELHSRHSESPVSVPLQAEGAQLYRKDERAIVRTDTLALHLTPERSFEAASSHLEELVSSHESRDKRLSPKEPTSNALDERAGKKQLSTRHDVPGARRAEGAYRPTTAPLNSMIEPFNGFSSRPSTSRERNAWIAEVRKQPSPRLPSTPPGFQTSPTRVPRVSTPRITRDTIVKFRGIFGPLMKVPKEFRDEFPCYSPSSPSKLNLVRDWMKEQLAATSASKIKDELVEMGHRGQFILASPNQLSPSPSADLPAPSLSLLAVSTRSRGKTQGKTISMIRKGKYVEREEPPTDMLETGRV